MMRCRCNFYDQEQKNGSKIVLIIALSTTEYQYKGWYIVHLARRAAFSENLYTMMF